MSINIDMLKTQRRPDPALGGSELQDTFIMGLTPRSAVPLRRLGVRLPEGDWLGGLAPGLGTVLHSVQGDVRGPARHA